MCPSVFRLVWKLASVLLLMGSEARNMKTMRLSTRLVVSLFVVVTLASVTWAGAGPVINGGFETGNFSGWTH